MPKNTAREGAWVPFIEQAEKELSIAYDGLGASIKRDSVTITFYQGEVGVYAYTFLTDGPAEVRLDGLDGKVKMKLPV